MRVFLSSANHTRQLLLAKMFDSKNFEIDPLRLRCGPKGQGSAGDPKSIFLTFETYQTTLIRGFRDMPAGNGTSLLTLRGCWMDRLTWKLK